MREQANVKEEQEHETIEKSDRKVVSGTSRSQVSGETGAGTDPDFDVIDPLSGADNGPADQ